MAKRREAASKGTAGSNKFALLEGVDVTDEPESMQPRKSRTTKDKTTTATPPPNGRLLSETQGLWEPQEAEETCAPIEKLDSYMLCLIFSHLHDGPLLARLRLVCGRWRGLIEEDKLLWKTLLWEDFHWQKEVPRGKGRAKRNRKRAKVVYRQHYITLSLARQAEGKNIQLRHRAKLARTAHLMRRVVTVLYDRQLGLRSDGRHPWKLCNHHVDWVTIHEDWPRLRWCSCRACGVDVLVKPAKEEHWIKNYPEILDDKELYYYLVLAERAPDTREDLVAKAYATYSAFLKSVGVTTPVLAPSASPHDEPQPQDETDPYG